MTDGRADAIRRLGKITKTAVASCLRPFDLALTRASSLDSLRAEYAETQRRLKEVCDRHFLQSLPVHQRLELEGLLPRSSAQILQDVFVLSELNFKRGGFFVEFGASGGTQGSNTLLLEREFGWHGILAEPARAWHEELRASRRAFISTKCVWRSSGEYLEFNEAPSPYLSTVDAFSRSDSWAAHRTNGRLYGVDTISLLDLLKEGSAPFEIDYLSIDTEGSELEILQAFDFSRYRISVITCEHNFTPAREKIRSLLAQHGYIRKFEDLSQFDDWYVKT